MASSESRKAKVQILALPSGAVLLPGVTIRIPTGARVLDGLEVGAEIGLVPRLRTTINSGYLSNNFDFNKVLDVGVLAKINEMHGSSLVVETISRLQILDFPLVDEKKDKPASQALVKVEITNDIDGSFDTTELEDIKRAAAKWLGVKRGLVIKTSLPNTRRAAGGLADLLSAILPLTFEEKVIVLRSVNIQDRIDVLKTVSKRLDKVTKPGSRELVLRQQLNDAENKTKAKGEDEDELDDLGKKLENVDLGEDGRKIVDRELKRLKRMHPSQTEYQVSRNYLETLAEIPWGVYTNDHMDANPVEKARKILDQDHYGLEKVKKRLLEYLAVLNLKQKRGNQEVVSDDNKPKIMTMDKSPILLLVGPPGVGKTSLAKSVAKALGRKFHRISLGGVRDEAEIRGHRRTYVGAMPGVLVQALKKVGAMNPVILLDEIDKVSQNNFHGDPSAALLEVLDPEQNHTFTDHYVNFPVDLSKTLFIATANDLNDIPAPLFDRMETIPIEGYTHSEKLQIASTYLLPKQRENNALDNSQIAVPAPTLLKLISGYTREAGVRNLDRQLGSLCRAKAVESLDSKDTYNPEVAPEDLDKYLGRPPFVADHLNDEVDEYVDSVSGRILCRHTYGVVNGLAYMGSGNGGLLMFEVTSMPGNGHLKYTGHLGNVISESAELALSWVRSNAFALGLTESPTVDVLAGLDLHLHAPGGAIPKDGPSAGVAMTIGIISCLAKKEVPRNIAMTGEMTLRGKILEVGGIREKLLGAQSAGIKKVILPFRCRRVVEEECLFLNEKDGVEHMDVVYGKYLWDVLAEVWPEEKFPMALESSL